MALRLDIESEVEPTKLRLSELAQLFCFAYGNGVLISSYFIITLPIEAKRISSEHSAAILGGFILLAGITQLICPVVGLVSDRTTHRWGKRRPFILVGGVVGVVGLFLQLVSRYYEWWGCYTLAFLVSMLSLNVIYSCMNGFVPDIVPDEQIGRANGIIAMLTVSGAVSSFTVFSYLSRADYGLNQFYMFYIVVITVTTWIMFAKSGEIENRTARVSYERLSINIGSADLWTEIKEAFYLSPTEHRDFFLVLVSRTMYYMGVSSQTFLMYYIRDILLMSEHDSEKFTSTLAVIGQFCGVFTAFPVGQLSDVMANGRRIYIYLSCVIMAIGNVSFLLATTRESVMLITGIVGAANGAYLTMDGSLAFDALPNKEEAARFMGIWGVGAFIGTALGPTIGGPILLLNYDADSGGYSIFGYAILLFLSAIYLTASAVILAFTRVS